MTVDRKYMPQPIARGTGKGCHSIGKYARAKGTHNMRFSNAPMQTPAPLSIIVAGATLLRWLQASLILKRCDQDLTIINQVCLAGFKLQFSGSAHLKGSRPLLVFSFASLELSCSGLVLHRRSLPPQPPQRLPFFALIELDEQQGTLTARGRGGGLAQWSRLEQKSP